MSKFLQQLEHIVPNELIDLYSKVEHCFMLLNYNSHLDDLYSVFDTADLLPTTIRDKVDYTYRVHITSVLSLQGLVLSNSAHEKFFNLVCLLQAFSLLAVTSIHELVSSYSDMHENDESIFFATIIDDLIDLPIATTLQMVSYLSPDLLKALHTDHLTVEIISSSKALGLERFKLCPFNNKGFFATTLHRTNNFGLSTSAYLMAYSEDILTYVNNISDNNPLLLTQYLANEIILLVLCSSTPDDILEATMLEVTEKLSDSTTNTLRINTIILKYMRDNTHG